MAMLFFRAIQKKQKISKIWYLKIIRFLRLDSWVDMLSFDEFLAEGPLKPIPKTEKPNSFHGNYGGKGNKGGEPTDSLDHIFQKHDTGYHHTPKEHHRDKHDHALIKATDKLAADRSEKLLHRIKAKMASAFFKTKLAIKEEFNGD